MPTNGLGYFDPPRARLHQQTVILNDEQIKALPSQRVEVVPQPGEGLANILVAVAWRRDFLGGAYTNDSPDGYVVIVTGGSLSDQSGILRNPTFVVADRGFALNALATFCPPSGPYQGLPISTFHPYDGNEALVVNAWNTDGDYEGGHPDNTLTVTVSYLVLNLATGSFV